jgi:hypothetical protein
MSALQPLRLARVPEGENGIPSDLYGCRAAVGHRYMAEVPIGIDTMLMLYDSLRLGELVALQGRHINMEKR